MLAQISSFSCYASLPRVIYDEYLCQRRDKDYILFKIT